MDDPEKLTTPGTQYTGRKQNRTQKTQKMSNTDPTKNQGWTQTPAKGKQFLSLLRHPLCYSYSQYLFDTTIHKHAQKHNKTWAFLQTTGDKDEPNIVCM